MSLIRWEPFGEMVTLRDAMDRLFEESVVGMPMRRREGPAVLALDVYETEDDLKVEASLPGFKPDDVDISVVGNTLVIKADSAQEEESEKGRYHYRERRYGSYRRTVSLPADVDGGRAEATFEDGVLNDKQSLHIENDEVRNHVESLVNQPDVSLDKRFVYYLLCATGVCVVPLSSFATELQGFRSTLLETD